MRLRDLYDRIETCRVRYWDISKKTRIEHGLRHDVGELGYSGARVVEISTELISRAFRGLYAFRPDSLSALVQFGKDREFGSPEEVIATIAPMIAELEQKLDNVAHHLTDT
jgi:hypothetical protein